MLIYLISIFSKCPSIPFRIISRCLLVLGDASVDKEAACSVGEEPGGVVSIANRGLLNSPRWRGKGTGVPTVNTHENTVDNRVFKQIIRWGLSINNFSKYGIKKRTLKSEISYTKKNLCKEVLPLDYPMRHNLSILLAWEIFVKTQMHEANFLDYIQILFLFSS